MKLIINGQPKTFTAPATIASVLQAEGMGDMKLAIALNGTFVPKAQHADTALNDNDEIEIVAPMQGG